MIAPTDTDSGHDHRARVRQSTVPATTAAPVPLTPITSVLWAGDSVAYDLAPAVMASLTAAGSTSTTSSRIPGSG